MGRMSALITSRPPMLSEPREKPEPHQTTTCPDTLKSHAQNAGQKQGQQQQQNGDKRHDIAASMRYWKDPGDGSLPPPINVTSDTVTNERPVVNQNFVVRDVTGEEDTYTLERNGFQFRRHASEMKELDEFRDDENVKARYFPECEQLLKDVTGASRVFFFDHRTRYGPSDWHSLGKGNVNSRGPLMRAHVDQSYDGAELLLRRLFPDEADELVKRRYQIINVWRPIKTIRKDPLAVTDAASVPDEDLAPASIIYPGYRSESWTVRPSNGHRWYFKYQQEPDEVLLIKCFDSRTDVARRALHSAFADPDEAEAENRQSIEARALLFYDE